MGRRIGWGLFALLALAMAGYGLAYLPLGERMFPDIVAASFRERPVAIYAHAICGGIGLALAPFQFVRGSFSRRPRLHRALGRVYLVGVLGTGASGLYMSFFAYGGLAAGAGFFGMATANLVCGQLGLRAILRRDVPTHRAWMARSAAVMFSAVTFRLWLPILAPLLGDFRSAYAADAWVSWVPNLLAAEWLLRRLGWVGAGRAALVGAA